jgi:hypothetical protein
VSEDHATTSYAGVYESFLEIPDEELWAYIRACWASWWSERAVAYRRHVGDTDATPRMAVVLQHMVPARCAGVTFTAEPLHGDRTRMVINAAPGLGVAVVSGIVQPEQYTLAKTPDLHLLESRLLHPNGPPLLPPEVVRQLLQPVGRALKRRDHQRALVDRSAGEGIRHARPLQSRRLGPAHDHGA